MLLQIDYKLILPKIVYVIEKKHHKKFTEYF
ncbi:hypothetical protein ECH_0984 [Ehrlichia chaffeensis str. Arkansas]|uniref:NERD domain-containing protein n=1 Tax=Ehrlichia chaffeensis (strain ATCC CRL-10679 / Arkansas) TaxID=205920 RepID=Q2GFL2_EHRCR|nr:hypothetical protein ECH_0984 [Ehrlichia chaffeensis str. Arkansas]